MPQSFENTTEKLTKPLNGALNIFSSSNCKGSRYVQMQNPAQIEPIVYHGREDLTRVEHKLRDKKNYSLCKATGRAGLPLSSTSTISVAI